MSATNNGKNNLNNKDVLDKILATLDAMSKDQQEKNKKMSDALDIMSKDVKDNKKKREKKEDNKDFGFGNIKKSLSKTATAKFKNKLVDKLGEEGAEKALGKVNVIVSAVKTTAEIIKKSTKAAVKESSKLASEEINLAGSVMTKTANIATTAMTDPINGLGQAIDGLGGAFGTIGSKFGKVGQAVGGTFGGIIGQFSKFETGTLKEFSKIDHAAREIQKQFGLTQSQVETFENASIQAAKMVAQEWGKGYSDIIKAQKNLAETTGRNIVLGDTDYNEYFGLSQVAGEENAAGIVTGLQEYNHDIAAANDMFLDMLKNADKIGISLIKSTKDVVQNLKLANKYNFKEGSKSIMDMAVWANKTKFNLSSIGNVIETVNSGGVESAITSAAKLQVLGGDFAIQSNPLSMLYESLEDPQALAKRVQQMVANKGRFDVETGETMLSGNDIRMLQAAAKAIGMSSEELNVMAKEAMRRNEVNKQLSAASGLTEEQKDLIASKAQWDKEKQQFYVTNLQGERTYASDINTSNIQNFDLKPELSNEEKLVDYAGKTFSQVDEIAKVVAGKSIKDAELGETQQGLFKTLISTTKSVMNEAYNSLGGIMGEMSETIKTQLTELVPLVSQVLQATIPLIPNLISLFKPILQILNDTIIPLFNNLSEPLMKMANQIVPLVGNIAKSLSPLIESYINNIAPMVQTAGDALLMYTSTVGAYHKAILDGVLPIINNSLKAIQPAIERISDIIINQVMPYISNFFELIGEPISNLVGILGEIMATTMELIAPSLFKIVEMTGMVVKAIFDVINPILSIIESIYDMLVTIFEPILKIIINFIGNIIGAIGVVVEVIRPPLELIAKMVKGIANFLRIGKKENDKVADSVEVIGGKNGMLPNDIWKNRSIPFQEVYNNSDFKIPTVEQRSTIVKVQPIGSNIAPIDYSKNINIRNNRNIENNTNNNGTLNNNLPTNRKYGNVQEQTNKNETIKVDINGKITLEAGNISMDILSVMLGDMMFKRKLTDIVLDQISRNKNGGRNDSLNNI